MGRKSPIASTSMNNHNDFLSVMLQNLRIVCAVCFAVHFSIAFFTVSNRRCAYDDAKN
jgi:hypothetical protein